MADLEATLKKAEAIIEKLMKDNAELVKCISCSKHLVAEAWREMRGYEDCTDVSIIMPEDVWETFLKHYSVSDDMTEMVWGDIKTILKKECGVVEVLTVEPSPSNGSIGGMLEALGFKSTNES